VRFRDLLGLALAALFRQKVRTLLTTLGVVFGSFVLVASLSVRGGVQETVVREYRRFGELRRIDVRPRYVPVQTSIPTEVTDIRGTMSDARRERLRQAAATHWPGHQARANRVKVKLDRARLDALAKIPGVRAAEPVLISDCRVSLGGKVERAGSVAALPDDMTYRDRVIAGTFLPSADARCVVVSEYLLYRLGVADDAALAAVVGKKLRLEYYTSRPVPLLLLALQREPAAATVAQERALQKVLERLPEAVGKMGLTEAEQAAALKILRRPEKAPAAKEESVAAELTVCGVLRLAGEQKQGLRWDRTVPNPDLVVPARTAEELLLRLTQVRENGFDLATVEVEQMEDVKAVSKQIDAMGLHAHSLAQFAERERFTYLLIFSAMTVIAVVSLLVSGLGITNTMLMSVLERVREIGVMKAVGARDGHIQLMFLIEGALVGLTGGLLGLLLSWAASFPGDAWVRSTVESGLQVKLQESIFIFPWWLLVGVPVFACAVTTLAAYYPARRAARVNPVRALRHE
jgi:putative ABC transport system permease protein